MNAHTEIKRGRGHAINAREVAMSMLSDGRWRTSQEVAERTGAHIDTMRAVLANLTQERALDCETVCRVNTYRLRNKEAAQDTNESGWPAGATPCEASWLEYMPGAGVSGKGKIPPDMYPVTEFLRGNRKTVFDALELLGEATSPEITAHLIGNGTELGKGQVGASLRILARYGLIQNNGLTGVKARWRVADDQEDAQ